MNSQPKRSHRRWRRSEGAVLKTTSLYLIVLSSFTSDGIRVAEASTRRRRNKDDGGGKAIPSSLERMKNTTRRRGVLSSNTAAAIRAEKPIGIASTSSHAEEVLLMDTSHRMHQLTLLDRFVELEIREPDFEALLTEEMRQQQAVEKRRPSLVSILAYRYTGGRFWSTATLILASFATLLWFCPWLSESRLALQSAVGIPLLSMLSSSVSGVALQPLQTLMLEVLSVLQLFVTPEMLKYSQETLLPAFWKVFQKMLLMDAWRRFWRIIGGLYKHFVGHQMEGISSSTYVFEDEAVIELVSPWVRAPLLYLEQVLRRGTRSIVKSSIQRNTQKRIRLALEGAVRILIEAGDAEAPVVEGLVETATS